MSIYVVGSKHNNFLELDEGREKFLVDVPHKGDNIDNLNPWYCELTALYYMWKHSSANIIGLEHYRRFFANANNQGWSRLTKNQANELLDKSDIIVTEFFHRKDYSAFMWFADAKYMKWLDIFLSVLEDTEKNLGTRFANYLKGPSLIQCNMFIGKKPLLDKYCKDLFNLLKAYDEKAGLDDSNRRMDGYLAEHFFGFWLSLANARMAKVPKLELRYLRTGVPDGEKIRTIY